MTDQTLQSLYAIGSGGVTGLGLGNSIEKQLWLPESTTDNLQTALYERLRSNALAEKVGTIAHGQADDKLAALALRCLHLDGAAHHIYDVFGDGHAKAGALAWPSPPLSPFQRRGSTIR